MPFANHDAYCRPMQLQEKQMTCLNDLPHVTCVNSSYLRETLIQLLVMLMPCEKNTEVGDIEW